MRTPALEALAAERRELDAREAAGLQQLATYDAAEECRGDGFCSTAEALQGAVPHDRRRGAGHVELARQLQVLPKVQPRSATAPSLGSTHR
jgi:hypothetical protein